MYLVAFLWISKISLVLSSWFLMKSSDATTSQHELFGYIAEEFTKTTLLVSFSAILT